MRSIWKGAISFGLVTIPVKLYSATEERDVSFHQVHRADGGRVRYKRVCSVDGEEITYGDIAKGYELPTGETVVLSDEDLADLPLSTSRAIEVLQFVPLEQVDPIYFAKSYYLEPERTGTKPYVLLRQALEESGKVALVKVALRQREALGTLRVRHGVFVLETMIWPDEVRTPDFAFLDDEVEVRPQELAMAGSLIETLAGDFDPGQYTDGYREALQALIDAKIAGREVVVPAAAEAPSGTVVDLMAALRASVDAARKGQSAAVPSGPDDHPDAAVAPAAAVPAATAVSGPGARGSATKPAARRPGAPDDAARSAGKSSARKVEKESTAPQPPARKSTAKAAARKSAPTKRASSGRSAPSTSDQAAAEEPTRPRRSRRTA